MIGYFIALFCTIYVNVNGIFDLINKNTHTDVVMYENTIANALVYADDFISHSQKVRQNQIDILNDYREI